MGFTLVSCPGIRQLVARWDTVSVDWEKLTITNETQNKSLPIEPMSTMDAMMLERGGFIPYLKARLHMAKENQKEL